MLSRLAYLLPFNVPSPAWTKCDAPVPDPDSYDTVEEEEFGFTIRHKTTGMLYRFFAGTRGNSWYCAEPHNASLGVKVEQALRINQLYSRAARFDVRDYHFPLQYETWSLPPYQLHFAIHQLSTHRFRSMHALVS